MDEPSQSKEEEQAARLAIASLAAGKQGSLERLYAIYSAPLFAMLLRILKDRGTAEEILQDLFVRCHERAGDYDRAKGKPYTWLATIGRRLALDRLRKQRREPQILDERREQASPSGDSKSQDGLVSTQLAHDVESLRPHLRALGDTRRRVLEAAYFQGLTQAEIAEEFNLPLGTVKSELRRGMMQLREHFLGSHDR